MFQPLRDAPSPLLFSSRRQLSFASLNSCPNNRQYFHLIHIFHPLIYPIKATNDLSIQFRCLTSLENMRLTKKSSLRQTSWLPSQFSLQNEKMIKKFCKMAIFWQIFEKTRYKIVLKWWIIMFSRLLIRWKNQICGELRTHQFSLQNAKKIENIAKCQIFDRFSKKNVYQ